MTLRLQRCLRPAHRQGPGTPPLLVPKPVANAPMTPARSSTPRLHPCQAADVVSALVLGFLPWSGCSQGGFYGTGVQGTHGEGCQAIYQPAAAAEARFAAAQRQAPQAAASPVATAEAAALTGLPVAGAAAHDDVLASIAVSSSISINQNADIDLPASRSENSNSKGTSSGNIGQSNGPEGPVTVYQQQGTALEQLQQVPESVKDLVREILKADNAARTKQLVDDAWQTLE